LSELKQRAVRSTGSLGLATILLISTTGCMTALKTGEQAQTELIDPNSQIPTRGIPGSADGGQLPIDPPPEAQSYSETPESGAHSTGNTGLIGTFPALEQAQPAAPSINLPETGRERSLTGQPDALDHLTSLSELVEVVGKGDISHYRRRIGAGTLYMTLL
jgi:hypothetical protein